MKRYPRRDTVSIKRGCRASSSAALRQPIGGLQHRVADELVAPYPARLVRMPAAPTSAHSRARVGASVPAFPSQINVAFVVSVEPVEAYANRYRRRR